MDHEEADEFIANLTDDQVRDFANTAYDDLKKASEDHPNSEWHQACFAGLLRLCNEMDKRGIKSGLVH